MSDGLVFLAGLLVGAVLAAVFMHGYLQGARTYGIDLDVKDAEYRGKGLGL